MTQRTVLPLLAKGLRRWMATGTGFLAVVALLGWALLVPSGAAAQTAGPTPTPPAEATPTTGPAGQVQLGIQKTVAPATAPVGTQLTYTILVTNNGSADAHNVVVSDTLPDQLKVLSVTTTKGQATINGQTVTVSIDTLAPGELVTVKIVAVVIGGTSGQTVHNVAQAVSSETTTPVIATVDALISTTPLPRSGAAGDLLLPLLLGVLAVLIGGGLVLRRRPAALR